MVAHVSRDFQKVADLVFAQGPHLFAVGSRRTDALAGIAGNHSPQDRLFERASKDHVDLQHAARREATRAQRSKCVLDLLRRQSAATHAAQVWRQPADAKVIVHICLGSHAMAHGVGKPALEIYGKRLVASEDELADLRLALRLEQAGSDDLFGAGEELLP